LRIFTTQATGMKNNSVKKWALRVSVTILFIAGLLLGIVIKPSLAYAHTTVDGNYTICHQQKLDPSFITQLRHADQLLKASELYDSTLKLSVCLNDGNYYPVLMGKIRGAAFGWGFAHEVVLGCPVNAGNNYGILNGYRYNLTELLAHEATHCMEFNHYGLLHSNVFDTKHAWWKWEGYPEYVARKGKADLGNNIGHLVEVEKTDNNGWINFGDSTGVVIPYYKAWLLVQYCMDVRKLTFDQLLKDPVDEKEVTRAMMTWYQQRSH